MRNLLLVTFITLLLLFYQSGEVLSQTEGNFELVNGERIQILPSSEREDRKNYEIQLKLHVEELTTGNLKLIIHSEDILAIQFINTTGTYNISWGYLEEVILEYHGSDITSGSYSIDIINTRFDQDYLLTKILLVAGAIALIVLILRAYRYTI